MGTVTFSLTAILDGQYGFESVGDPLSVEAVTIDGSPYILVASYYGNSV